MNELAKAFCEEMLACGVLQFGDFTLKSGAQSPYFFQLGEMFTNGQHLRSLGDFYAKTICEREIFDSFDVLFGSAYKGIPIAVATGTSLHNQGIRKDVAFNRKEAKTHGEGGWLIGAEVEGKKVLIVDDVISDGTEKRNSTNLVEQAGGDVVGVLIGLDRAETPREIRNDLPYIQLTESTEGTPLYSIAHLDDVIELVRDSDQFEKTLVTSMMTYRQEIATY